MKVMSVFGTRPEAIKMCPLVKEMEKTEGIKSIVCLTGQHKEMLQQVIDIFGINIDYNLDIMQPNQTLFSITANILAGMEPVLKKEKPDIVLVHGDTTTSFAVALAAFYQQTAVGHVEAGLRTYNKYSPYPEEMNRVLTSRIAALHFAPTVNNQKNLLLENVTENVFVTGNTVIDAFKTTICKNYRFKDKTLQEIDLTNKRCILMTAHRRENLGQPLKNICNAVRRITEMFADVVVVYPVHLNPAVRETVFGILGDTTNVFLTEPLDVEDMHNIMSQSYLVLTDSGGLQEEAPSCGVPVLVTRKETERPEAVEAGTVRVIGVEENEIFKNTYQLLTDHSAYECMAHAVNPYGDGHASERIANLIKKWYSDNMIN